MKKYKEYLVLIIFTMGTQALIYFVIKLFINNYNIINSIINIPLIKPFIYIYNLWYPFIIIITFLIYKHNKNIFRHLIGALLLGAIFAQITFILYPSMIIRPIVEVHSITDWVLNFTYVKDTPAVNCIPSMHCIYCFIVIFYLTKCKNMNYKIKILSIIFLLIIVLSTMFTKQHVIEDVILAFIYSVIAIGVIEVSKKRIDQIFKKLNM